MSAPNWHKSWRGEESYNWNNYDVSRETDFHSVVVSALCHDGERSAQVFLISIWISSLLQQNPSTKSALCFARQLKMLGNYSNAWRIPSAC